MLIKEALLLCIAWHKISGFQLKLHAADHGWIHTLTTMFQFQPELSAVMYLIQ